MDGPRDETFDLLRGRVRVVPDCRKIRLSPALLIRIKIQSGIVVCRAGDVHVRDRVDPACRDGSKRRAALAAALESAVATIGAGEVGGGAFPCVVADETAFECQQVHGVFDRAGADRMALPPGGDSGFWDRGTD